MTESRPPSIGTVIELPPDTLQGLANIAGYASADTTRQILNGVRFTLEDGGRLIATDGKRPACCPAEQSRVIRMYQMPNYMAIISFG